MTENIYSEKSIIYIIIINNNNEKMCVTNTRDTVVCDILFRKDCATRKVLFTWEGISIISFLILTLRARDSSIILPFTVRCVM